MLILIVFDFGGWLAALLFTCARKYATTKHKKKGRCININKTALRCKADYKIFIFFSCDISTQSDQRKKAKKKNVTQSNTNCYCSANYKDKFENTKIFIIEKEYNARQLKKTEQASSI